MFGVFTFTLTHFLAKNIFPEGMGVYKIHVVVEILKGWGACFSGQKMESWGGGGTYVKFLPWWGYGYFLELQIISLFYLTSHVSIESF